MGGRMAKRNRSKQTRRARRRTATQTRALLLENADRKAAIRASSVQASVDRSRREAEERLELDEYETVMLRVGPRISQIAPILTMSDLLQNAAAKLNYSDPWLHALYEQKRQTWRDLAEQSAEGQLLHALEKKLLQWIPMPTPDDVGFSQRKRSVLANTEYVCYLANNGHWYIAREVCEMGLDDEGRPEPYFDSNGNRIDLQVEVWCGPHVNEDAAQRAMMFHLSEGRNLEIDPESALPPDMSDWREEAKKRLRSFAPFRHAPMAEEKEKTRRDRPNVEPDISSPEICRSAAAKIGKRKQLPRELGFMPEDTRLAQNRESAR